MLEVMDYLCSDLILGHDFMELHDKTVFEMGGLRDFLIMLR